MRHQQNEYTKWKAVNLETGADDGLDAGHHPFVIIVPRMVLIEVLLELVVPVAKQKGGREQLFGQQVSVIIDLIGDDDAI